MLVYNGLNKSHLSSIMDEEIKIYTVLMTACFLIVLVSTATLYGFLPGALLFVTAIYVGRAVWAWMHDFESGFVKMMKRVEDNRAAARSDGMQRLREQAETDRIGEIAAKKFQNGLHGDEFKKRVQFLCEEHLREQQDKEYARTHSLRVSKQIFSKQ